MSTKGSMRDELVTTVEALLYAAESQVSAERLSEVITAAAGDEESAPADAESVRLACIELETRYRASGSALQVIEVAGGYRLGTLPRHDGAIRALRDAGRPSGLSLPLLETLAIIAYRQPATVAEMTAIRGKDPTAAIRRLRDLGLVRVAGRRHTVGRPFTYGTTERFLELFGLRDLSELPAPEEFQELLEA